VLLAAAPIDVLHAMTDKLGHVQSYHVEGVQHQYGRYTLTGDIGRHAGQVTVTRHGGHATLRRIGKRAFVRADRRFYTLTGVRPKYVDSYAGRWLKILPQQKYDEVTTLYPQTLARCLATTPASDVVAGGTATVEGQPAQVLRHLGVAHGQSRGRLLVGEDSRLLRLTRVGPERPIGSFCGRHQAMNRQDLTFSRFGARVHIKVPKHVLRVHDFAR
jgi:hypothetical protein